MNTRALTFLSVAAVLACHCGGLRAQQAQLIREKSPIEATFASLAKCLDSRQMKCVPGFIAIAGASLGVDGPKLTAQALKDGLSSDSSLQCLFWGVSCTSRESARCSLSRIAKNAPFGKAYLYHSTWQKEVTTQGNSSECATTTFIFQLENEDWKLVAVPYT